MYPDFCFDNCAFGGSKDGFFGDAILCAGVLGFRYTDDCIVGLFAVFVFDSVYCSECARDVSLAGFTDGFGFDDGAEDKIYFAISGAFARAWINVGGGDVAAHNV